MDWLRGFTRPPRRTCASHGEPHAADTFQAVTPEDERRCLAQVDLLPEDATATTP